MNDKNSGFTALMIMIPIAIILAFIAGYLLKLNPTLLYLLSHSPDYTSDSATNPYVKPTPIATVGPICKMYGILDQDQYLVKYIVKPGDSLISIAKNQLSDPSNINVIIANNKDRLPSLAGNNPGLEIGWQLYLPSRDLPPVSDQILGSVGKVTDIKDNYFELMFVQKQPEYGGSTFYIYTPPDSNPANVVKIGDCVNVVYDYSGNILLKVTSQ